MFYLLDYFIIVLLNNEYKTVKTVRQLKVDISINWIPVRIARICDDSKCCWFCDKENWREGRRILGLEHWGFANNVRIKAKLRGISSIHYIIQVFQTIKEFYTNCNTTIQDIMIRRIRREKWIKPIH